MPKPVADNATERATYDVFISHASEDKPAVARPLAAALEEIGLRVWLDEQELRLGDQLRRKLNEGLSCSTYGIVILSHAFFAKPWPQEELDALMGREGFDSKVVLPIRHGISHEEVREYHPTLANKLSVSTENGLANIVNQIVSVAQATPMSDQTTQGPHSRPETDQGSSHIFDELKELEARAKTCLSRVLEIKDPNANENTDSVIAANMPSHDEYGKVDDAIREFCYSILGRAPEPHEWEAHYQRLMTLDEKGRRPKTSQEGFQNQLDWIRLSRSFVRQLMARQVKR
jgi:hypothetical protein